IPLHRDGLAKAVLAVGTHPEHHLGPVGLVLILQKLHQARRPPDAQHQHPSRSRVQGAGMADAPHTQEPLRRGHHVVGRAGRGLQHVEHPVQRLPAPALPAVSPVAIHPAASAARRVASGRPKPRLCAHGARRHPCPPTRSDGTPTATPSSARATASSTRTRARSTGRSSVQPAARGCPPPPSSAATRLTSTRPWERMPTRVLPSGSSRKTSATSTPLIMRGYWTNPSASS